MCHASIIQRTKQSTDETFVVPVFLESNQIEEYTMVVHCQRNLVLVSILKFMSPVSGQRNVYYFEEMQATVQRIISKDLELQIEKSLVNDVVLKDVLLLSQNKKTVPIARQASTSSPRTITVGMGSSLLHYFTFQTTRGVCYSPIDVCHSKVEQLFVKYIKIIRHVLLKPRSCEEQKVVEYGIKVVDTEIIPNQTLSLWFVGFMSAITQPPTEVYVCYEDGNLVQATRVVDLALRLL